MAFDIGENVTSRWAGNGVVVGEMFRDDDGDSFQRVRFENPLLGERDYLVKKLEAANNLQ
jgi:hypothetical protein